MTAQLRVLSVGVLASNVVELVMAQRAAAAAHHVGPLPRVHISTVVSTQHFAYILHAPTVNAHRRAMQALYAAHVDLGGRLNEATLGAVLDAAVRRPVFHPDAHQLRRQEEADWLRADM